MLESIKNYLQFIVDNWTYIFTIICLIVLIVVRIKAFVSKSKEERLQAVKAQIKQVILKWCTEAEIDYIDWTQAGSIKRSQVIQQIYADYPVLSQVIDQDGLMAWIDRTIDDALKTMRKIVEENIVIEPATNVDGTSEIDC